MSKLVEVEGIRGYGQNRPAYIDPSEVIAVDRYGTEIGGRWVAMNLYLRGGSKIAISDTVENRRKLKLL